MNLSMYEFAGVLQDDEPGIGTRKMLNYEFHKKNMKAVITDKNKESYIKRWTENFEKNLRDFIENL